MWASQNPLVLHRQHLSRDEVQNVLRTRSATQSHLLVPRCVFKRGKQKWLVAGLKKMFDHPTPAPVPIRNCVRAQVVPVWLSCSWSTCIWTRITSICPQLSCPLAPRKIFFKVVRKCSFTQGRCPPKLLDFPAVSCLLPLPLLSLASVCHPVLFRPTRVL